MKKSMILLGMLGIGYAYAQSTDPYEGKVGINTEEPKATLEIQPSTANLAGTTNEGILAPRLSKTRIANIATPVEGTLVYATDNVYAGTDTKVVKITEKGYYFYNGTEWVKVQYKDEGSKWEYDTTLNRTRLKYLSDGVTERTSVNKDFFIGDSNYIQIDNPSSSPLGSQIAFSSPAGNVGMHMVVGDGNGNPFGAWAYGVTRNEGDFYIQDRSGSNNNRVITFKKDTNMVGIGDSNPTARLFVKSTSSDLYTSFFARAESRSDQQGIGIKSNNTANYLVSKGNADNSKRLIIDSRTDDNFSPKTNGHLGIIFSIQGVESTRISEEGNVGIGGVTTPSEKLEVAGSIKSSALAGTGVRNVVADASGKLIIGESADTTLKATDTTDQCTADKAGTIHYKEVAILGATNGEKKGVFGFCTKQNGNAVWVYLSNGGNIMQGTGTFGQGL